MSPSQKLTLKKGYTPEEVQRALKISEKIPIKKGLMNLLVHILKNPQQYEQAEKAQTTCPNEQLALKYNQELAKVDPKLATHNDNLIPKKALKVILKGRIEQISFNAYDYKTDIEAALKELRKRE